MFYLLKMACNEQNDNGWLFLHNGNWIFMISETLQQASLDTMNAPHWPNVISCLVSQLMQW